MARSIYKDEHELFRKTVKRFHPGEFVPHEARWREQHRVDAEAWTKAGEVGILLTDVPEEYGGGGGDLLLRSAW